MRMTPWTLLLVDDEDDLIEVSKIVLEDMQFEGRPMRILTAHSGNEARKFFDIESDIAVAFIDVVMETEHAGLDLVRYVREDLHNNQTRLILRTGNPGLAPQHEIVRHLEIDDYKEKTELTADRLETSVLTSLRSYRNLKARLRMERGLEQMIEASTALNGAISTIDFLRTSLIQIAAIVQVELDNEQISGAMALQRQDNELQVVVGLMGHEHAEGQPPASVLPSGLLNELQALGSFEGIHQVASGVVFTINVHHGETYHFWVGAPYQLPVDAVRMLRFFMAKLSTSLSNSMLRRELLDAQTDVLNRLCEAVECRSKETGSHIRRIALYSRKLAMLAGLDTEAIEVITVASPMHDIGKIAIPDRILNKPGKLDDEEWAIMKTHAEEGYRLLNHSHFTALQASAEIAISHHEKWDGSGYPRGLVGEQIPVMGRIVALVDVFDALLSRRAYKEGWPMERVIDEIKRLRGSHFDPRLVDLMLEHVGLFHGIFTQFPD